MACSGQVSHQIEAASEKAWAAYQTGGVADRVFWFLPGILFEKVTTFQSKRTSGGLPGMPRKHLSAFLFSAYNLGKRNTMQCHLPSSVDVYLSDAFHVRPSILRKYGAFDVSL